MSDAALMIGLGLATVFGGVIDLVIDELPPFEVGYACPMQEQVASTSERIGLDTIDRLHRGVLRTGAEDLRLAGCGLCIDTLASDR